MLTSTPQAQPNNTTFLFRDVPVLQTCAHVLSEARMMQSPQKDKPRILSFGCSVGEEIASLRSFFPSAEIYGCDIKEDILARAQRSVGHLATLFASTADNISAHGPYDLIMACNVLCRNPATHMAQRFPFSRFAELVEMLDGVLAPGGILVILNPSYRFRDTAVASGYSILSSDIVTPPHFVDLFAPDGTPALVQHTLLSRKAYTRGPGFAADHDEALGDCLFIKDGGALARHPTLQLSPVPEHFLPAQSYQRRVSDLIPQGVEFDELIDVHILHQLGQDATTGAPCYTMQYSWPSVVTPGVTYTRPATFHRLQA